MYFITHSGESDPGEQESVPPFAEALTLFDLNQDRRIGKAELRDPKAKARFDEHLDRDRTGFLDERGWEQFRNRRLGENALRSFNISDAGGIFASLDRQTGSIHKRGRLRGALGTCYASPTAAMASSTSPKEDGKVVAALVGAQGEVLHTADLDAGIKASPALADGCVSFRTQTALHGLAKKP